MATLSDYPPLFEFLSPNKVRIRVFPIGEFDHGGADPKSETEVEIAGLRATRRDWVSPTGQTIVFLIHDWRPDSRIEVDLPSPSETLNADLEEFLSELTFL